MFILALLFIVLMAMVSVTPTAVSAVKSFKSKSKVLLTEIFLPPANPSPAFNETSKIDISTNENLNANTCAYNVKEGDTL